MVTAHQTFGDMLRWNPHFHAGCTAEQQFARIATRPIVLEGGFDDEGTFFFIPFSGLQSMVEALRRRVIKLLVDHELLNENFARNLLSWKHSGFSIDNSVRILDKSSQESLAEYIARPPISLGKIRYEPFKARVLFHTTYSEYFRENLHMFDALDFLAELTPDAWASNERKRMTSPTHPAERLAAHSQVRPVRIADKGALGGDAVGSRKGAGGMEGFPLNRTDLGGTWLWTAVGK